MFKLSSNFIVPKIRAMYSARLVQKDYLDLLNCKSISEVTAVLRQRSNYSQVLQDLREGVVHRGQLEALVRKKIFYDTESLCKYELSAGEHFSMYIIMKMEIQQILRTLRLLSAGESPQYIYSMPLFFNKHTQIDLPALINVKSYSDFLAALGISPYRNLLADFLPEENQKIPLTKIEVALDSYIYKKIFSVIKKNTKGKVREELYGIFNSYIDPYNFVRIIRLKRYYRLPPSEIYPLLLPFGTLKQKQIQEMVESETFEQSIKIMLESNAGQKVKRTKYKYIDELPQKLNYAKCNHLIRFSTSPPVVMLSYIATTEIELSNIVTIIEGIKYQVPSEQIVKSLVFLT